MQTGGTLELKNVGRIAGRFSVAKYQRGYRWGVPEVERLLNDIWESDGKPYSLQPIVVKRLAEGEWELVDGQQRLTTLYLIQLYMKREGLKSAGPNYAITYETRPGTEAYLREPDPAVRESNIDYFHLYGAYERICTWFEAHGADRQYVADKLYIALFESVRVIWYEAPAQVDATTLFTRLNVGRIPLTDAELVKALMLSRAGRAPELAAQWDAIERDLQQPDIWAFVAGAAAAAHPTRIGLLLDTLAGGPRGRERPRFHTFDVLRERIEASPEAVWNDVLHLHAQVLGWFDDRSHYHKIGYLTAAGVSFEQVVALAEGRRKSDFEAQLDARIRDVLDLDPTRMAELRYDNRDRCHRLLLLMNVETVRRMTNSAERYPFRQHHASQWSLEHIHAQNAEQLNRADQWKAWLLEHREALAALPASDPRRDALLARVDLALVHVDRETFHELSRHVTDFFTRTDAADEASHDAMHSIGNLALLDAGANSALSNAVFEVKRRRILARDRRGEYIPVCTRNVFLKYYTDAGAQQIHFWGPEDRESYLAAMLEIVGPYLKAEEPRA